MLFQAAVQETVIFEADVVLYVGPAAPPFGSVVLYCQIVVLII